jgi:hypothetical protein
MVYTKITWAMVIYGVIGLDYFRLIELRQAGITTGMIPLALLDTLFMTSLLAGEFRGDTLDNLYIYAIITNYIFSLETKC